MSSHGLTDLTHRIELRLGGILASPNLDPAVQAALASLMDPERAGDLTLVDDLEVALAHVVLPGQSVPAIIHLVRAITIAQREPPHARGALERADAAGAEQGDPVARFTALFGLATLDCGDQAIERAADRLAAAEQQLALIDWDRMRVPTDERHLMRRQIYAQLRWLQGIVAARRTPPELDLARYQLRRALTDARGLGFESAVRVILAQVEFIRGDHRTAQLLFRRARHISRDPEELRAATIGLALCLTYLGRGEEAADILAASPDEGPADHRALRSGLLAALRLEGSVTDSAVGDVLRAAKVVARRAPADAALLRVTAAEALGAAGRPRQARVHAAEGWRLLPEDDRPSLTGVRAQRVLALATLSLGRVEESEGHARRAYELARAADLWEQEVLAVDVLAQALSAQARFDEMRAAWSAIRHRARMHDDDVAMAAALLGMTSAYLGLGDFGTAAVLWRQAEHKLRSQAYGPLAPLQVVDLYELQPGGVQPDAVEELVRAAAGARSTGLEMVEFRASSLLVRALSAAERLDEAEDVARALLDRIDARRRPHDAASVLDLLIDVIEQRDRAPAELLWRFQEAADRAGDVWLRIFAHVNVGERALAEGSVPLAVEHLTVAAEITNDSIATSASGRHAIRQSDIIHQVHSLLALAHHRQGDARDALQALELGRARLALQALLAERSESPGEDATRDERRLHAERAHLYRLLSEARVGTDVELTETLELRLVDLAGELDDLDDRRDGRAVARAALRGLEGLAVADLQAVLDDTDAAALEYSVAAGGVLGACVTGEEVHTFEVGAVADELAAMVGELRDGLLALDPDPPHVHALFELLIAPVAHLLDQTDRLVLIPDGALHALPFDILHATPAPPGTPWAERDLLVRHVSTTRAPSLRVACVLRERGDRATPGRWSIAAAPMDDVPRARGRRDEPEPVQVPAAREEVRRITAELGPAVAAARVLIGGAATVEAVKRLSAGEADVLHLACHGAAHADDPELSAIQLTPVGTQPPHDAVWRAHEIAQHRTGHRIIVLSACETGVGPVSAEGVLALSRAFLHAGATSVIASLWPVLDDATARLMPVLHAALAAGRTPAAALREMQLHALGRRSSAHPSVWAAFCVTGSP